MVGRTVAAIVALVVVAGCTAVRAVLGPREAQNDEQEDSLGVHGRRHDSLHGCGWPTLIHCNLIGPVIGRYIYSTGSDLKIILQKGACSRQSSLAPELTKLDQIGQKKRFGAFLH